MIWDHRGTGGCTSGGWIGIGFPSSLEDAKLLMLGHSSCSEAGSILFYSGYSYSWGAYCATRGVYPYCNEPNSNWDNYLLSKRNCYSILRNGNQKFCILKVLNAALKIHFLLGHPWRCAVGIGGTGIGDVFRLTFDECKAKFDGSNENFVYYAGSKHCQETTDYTHEITDGNTLWQSCSQGKSLHPWQCTVGIGGRAIGDVFRLTFDQCKAKFDGSREGFHYYPGSNHCQELTDYTPGITDGNTHWQSCTQGIHI